MKLGGLGIEFSFLAIEEFLGMYFEHLIFIIFC